MADLVGSKIYLDLVGEGATSLLNMALLPTCCRGARAKGLVSTESNTIHPATPSHTQHELLRDECRGVFENF